MGSPSILEGVEPPVKPVKLAGSRLPHHYRHLQREIKFDFAFLRRINIQNPARHSAKARKA
jgi:hypothetical protein